MKKSTPFFTQTKTPKWILILGAVFALIYFVVILFFFPPDNRILFGALILGQIFLIWQVLTYIFTVWDTERTFPYDTSFRPPVDVFITVAGEPLEIIEETIRAARDMDYPDFQIYVLNDGFVAKKQNWQEVEQLAMRLSVECITRKIAGGAKAGNINHALKVTQNPFIAIFDADHCPHRDFLQKTIPYFFRKKVGFLQTPQFYKNKDYGYTSRGAWEQQELFFGPICKGKNNYNAATMCGTNVVVRREALESVGGMCEESIGEDFVTGLFMHEKKWKSIYVPMILSEGLAPEDFLSYYKQQHRWARGALDVIFRYNPLFRRGTTIEQKVQYLSSASHFLSGLVIIMNALFPIIFFFTGAQPFIVSTMALATVFLPYMFITLYILQRSSDYAFTFKALAFSMGAFGIHISAMVSAAFHQKNAFAVTSKRQLGGSFYRLVIPHFIYFALAGVGMIFAIGRESFSPSVANNIAWALINCAVFLPMVFAASGQMIAEPSAAESNVALQREAAMRESFAITEK